MIHKMKLNEDPFNMIEKGDKTIELRLYDWKRKMINIGDEIEFQNSTNPTRILRCIVVNLYRFSSFKELYKNLPLLKCGYTEENIASASSSDMDTYYSKDEQNLYGVVGIEIALKYNG